MDKYIWWSDRFIYLILNVNKLGLSCAKLSSNWAQLSQVRMERGDFKNKIKLGIPETWTIDICWNMVCPGRQLSQCDNCPCKTPVNLCTACLVEPPKKKSFSWFLVRVAELNIQVCGCLAAWLADSSNKICLQQFHFWPHIRRSLLARLRNNKLIKN